MIPLSPRRLFVSAGLLAALSGGVICWMFAAPAEGAGPASPRVTGVRSAVATFNVDPVHSAAVFAIEWQAMTPFYGQFNDFSGTISYDGNDPSTFSCDVAIPVESIDTHNEQRDRHLKSPDFFNANEFPNIGFKSTGLTDNGDGTWTVKGDLSMHGQTHPIEAKVTHLLVKEGQRGTRCGVSATFQIKRTQWGMQSMQGLGDDVTLMVSMQSAGE